MIISEIGWKDTLRQFILQLKIGNIVKLNGFLFFLRKTPLIEKKSRPRCMRSIHLNK